MGGVKLLKASAGSGKTYKLAYEYVRTVIEEPMEYRHILAVTFTNKATEEMKRRIITEINELAKGRNTGYLKDLTEDLGYTEGTIASRAASAITKILHDYSRFAVLTIDKFFQRIIRSFIKELGVDMDFNLELRTDPLLATAADALIEDIAMNESLRKWVTGFIEERIEENKKWDIKSGLTELGGEIFREDYKRMGNAGIPGFREKLGKIVTEANKRYFSIIGSMRSDALKIFEIIYSSQLDTVDFAYGKNGFLSYVAKTADGIIEPYGARVQKALDSDEGWYSKKSLRKKDIENIIPSVRPLLESICTVYDTNRNFINTTELLRENFRNFALLSDLSEKITQICSSEGIMPISETNGILNKLVCGNDAPFIFEKAGNHFHRFMIDEFQDTSAMQWENFIPLLNNALAQSESDPVLLVGDVKQSIYRWRGGDWRILANEISKEFAYITRINLNTNYRSYRNVVEFNNNIIKGCIGLDNAELNGQLQEAGETKVISSVVKEQFTDMLEKAYEDHEQHAVSEEEKGYVNVTFYGEDDNGDTAPPVITRIEELQDRGYAPGDIAILVRYNADGVKIANMLLEHKSRNPESRYGYDVVTQEALTIGSSPAINFIVSCMRLAAGIDIGASSAIYNRWLGRPFDTPMPEKETAFFTGLKLLSAEEAFENIMVEFGLNREQANIAYLQAFHDQIISFYTASISDLSLFIKWWEENGASQSLNVPPNPSSINIVTIHKAKGLQYKAVIIPYCNWSMSPKPGSVIWSEDKKGGELSELGYLPVKYSDKMRNSSFSESYFNELVLSHVDNINTFYVAVTRAMEELHIMIPRTPKKNQGRISTLVEECLHITGGEVSVGMMKGRYIEHDRFRIMEFGEPVIREQETSAISGDVIKEGDELPAYGSFPIGCRLRLKLKGERYLGEAEQDYVMAPRNYGILMHKVFESATDSRDIYKRISGLFDDGEISKEESAHLKEAIEKSLKNNPVAAEWFGGGWKEVHNENDIIIPGIKSLKRPDRVMIDGGRVVVVDYKFGLNRPAWHSRQLKEYMQLLLQMGYADIQGYIWYVSAGDIEKIE